MRQPTRPLPDADLTALIAVLGTVTEQLLFEEFPERTFTRLADRLTDDGLLPHGSSRGHVNALLTDLMQRLHWARSQGPDDPYPEPMPREVVHDLNFPTGEKAVQAFIADVTALGGRDVWARPGHSRWVTKPASEQQPVDPPENWDVGVTFNELPPDPDFHARRAELTTLAARHGGSYRGYHT
jgi:hypothetical protein